MTQPTVVIKYGGHAMDKPELSEAFATDLAHLAGQGMRLVVVHGAGPRSAPCSHACGLKAALWTACA